MVNRVDVTDRLPTQSDTPVEAFVRRWQEFAASERANYGLFLIELCEVLGLPRPEPASGEPERDSYVFERPVTFHNPDGTTRPDLSTYIVTTAFVLETKQGL